MLIAKPELFVPYRPKTARRQGRINPGSPDENTVSVCLLPSNAAETGANCASKEGQLQ